MWCHDLREDESAACPWVITLAPIPRLTIDRTEALPTTFSWTTVVSATFGGECGATAFVKTRVLYALGSTPLRL
jgi:hypothetical protein